VCHQVPITWNCGPRHVDRANSNEVKIRLVHNVTSYIATHDLFLDYIAVSCISVVTAADIADAVWDEILTSHNVSESAASFVKHIAGLSGKYKRIAAIVRDGDGNLTSATMVLYANGSDYDNETNPVATYNVTATFVAQLLSEFGMKPQ